VNFELDDEVKAACTAPWWPLPRRPVAEGNRQGKDATDRDRPQVEALIQDPFFSTPQSARPAADANTAVKIDFLKPMTRPPRDAS